MSKLSKLKEDFDRVLIKYTDKSCEVLLIKGLNVFSGSSKCHENDNFNKKLGRKIALGRAEFASKVTAGIKTNRGNEFSTGGFKHLGITCGDTKQVDEHIINFLPNRESQEAS